MVKKHILVIFNQKKYPNASEYLAQMIGIFQTMDYLVDVLREEDDDFDEKLVAYAVQAEKTIECKAILSCNGIGMDRIPQMFGCLYVVYLDEECDSDTSFLMQGDKNTVLISTFFSATEWKEKYPNLVDALCIENYADDLEHRILQQTQLIFDIQELIAVKQGTPSVLKLLIQRCLDGKQLEQARNYINQYKMLCPVDFDVISMETMYALYAGNLDVALEWATTGTRKYPCNGDVHYNLAVIYEALEDWYRAWMEYGKAVYLYQYSGDMKAVQLGLKERLAGCRENYAKNPDAKYADMDLIQEKCYGLREWTFRNLNTQVLGSFFWETECVKRYAGIYNDYFFRQYSAHADVIHTKGEFLEVTEGRHFVLPAECEKYLLPIAVQTEGTVHRIDTGSEEQLIYQIYDRHFNYYRLPAAAEVVSSESVYYGRPIPLHHGKDRKKLVLNLFVDGLAQCELEGARFIENMPYTASFFGKGTVCTRTYSTSEWTYPSIATYVTGADTTHHMLFHGDLDGRIPEEYPTLAEYFREKGYHTAILNGDWRIIPTYGHARGYDQYLYQHQWTGGKTEMMIGELLDQIEMFRETDQFIWVSLGDLHDVADGLEMPHAVQSKMELAECGSVETGTTSVKQRHSEMKRMKYQKMMKRIDILLYVLYRYLEENFSDEEIIVSLFADHGQGYLVPEGGHFLSKERTNVAFMFRGAGVKQCITEEIMSTADYIQIMCKLADIPMKGVEIDGVLPKTFGGNGRTYAVCQSIHQKDPYYAAVYMDKSRFYFTNPYSTQDDGRFFLKKWEAELESGDGSKSSDEEIYRQCLKIVEEKIAPLVVYE